MEDLVLTPAECVALINQTLEIAYPTVLVEGEVASFKYNRDKYVFFDIKDDEATLGCFMMAFQLRTPLEDGMRVKVLAEPRLTRWGKFSLTIRQVMPVGEGSIKRAFEMLRAKLELEGLLDAARKRSLPALPRRIGVISSIESAGYADFAKIVNARWGGLTIQVADVQVQGLPAVEQNIAAIQYFNQQADPVDVLVIIRGGGSADDLAAYNDELLVRAIAASRIPTLVGVGHEVDTSLADLVADVRAATPSNAAQLVVPDRRELLAHIEATRQRLSRQIAGYHNLQRQHISHAQQRIAQAVDFGHARLQLGHTTERLASRQRHVMEQVRQRLLGNVRSLRQLDPQTVLRRGYALVRNADDTCIASGQKLHVGDMIQVEFTDSVVQSEVHHVRSKTT
ncbi:MAG TPA: exodeoxyribonuclease VII large subunit [Candidatus Saccharimonadales bacterium]|nr:exodeoxyribonuclease VII large subunit [Candidatus Saccharimonadales bacterium]